MKNNQIEHVLTQKNKIELFLKNNSENLNEGSKLLIKDSLIMCDDIIVTLTIIKQQSEIINKMNSMISKENFENNFIDLIFDKLPNGMESVKFIEVENQKGESIDKIGKWVNGPEGTYALRITQEDFNKCT